MQRADQPGQRDQDVIPGGFRWQRRARYLPWNVGQDLPALLIQAEGDRSGGEAGLVQVGEIGLHGRGERPGRAADGVPDPHDARGDAVPDQRLAVGIRHAPNLVSADSVEP